MTDTRLSSAIHILILVSEAETPMTSEQIGVSVGANASHIRRICGQLKRAGIIESGRGSRGFRLAVPAGELTLNRIYEAIYETDHVHIFDLHQNPNDHCIVGRHIRPVLTEAFREVEDRADLELRTQTLANCIERMREMIEEENA